MMMQENEKRNEMYIEEDERECRVCRCGEDIGPLFYPCACKGSIQYIHETCLVEWLRISGKRVCELCYAEFEFRNQYQENAPLHLSNFEILMGSLQLAGTHLPWVGRYAFVGILWLFVFPLLTTRVYKLFLVDSISDVYDVMTEWSPFSILVDCLLGLVIAWLIVVVLLGMTVLHEYVGSVDVPRIEQTSLRRFRHSLDANFSVLADRVVEVATAAAVDANYRITELQSVASFSRENLENIMFRPNPSHDRANPGTGVVSDGNRHQLIPATRPGEEELDTLLGIKGNLVRGVYSVILILLVNFSFLVVFELSPLLLGRLVYAGLHRWNLVMALDSSQGVGVYLKLGYAGIGSGMLINLIVFRLLLVKESLDQTSNLANRFWRYSTWIRTAMLHTLQMGLIGLFELFLLEEILGWVCHIGVMGISGDMSTVFQSRIQLCTTAPVKCFGIHWAVGSILVANWSALVSAFRKIVHPQFRLRMFTRWYDTKRHMRNSLFAPWLDYRMSIVLEQSSRWQKLMSILRSHVQEDGDESEASNPNSPSSRSARDENHMSAPFPADIPPATEMVSRSLLESVSYVLMVVLWSIPGMVLFLWTPIYILKNMTGGIFPIHLGPFAPPLTDAQTPLDIFLFLSMPYFLERFNFHATLLGWVKAIAKALTTPLNLHGYVLQPEYDFLKTGFVRSDVCVDLKRTDSSGDIKWDEPASNHSFRHSVSIVDPISNLSVLSDLQPGTRVNLICIAALVLPWQDICLNSMTDEPVVAMAVADSLGYCIPVFLRTRERVMPRFEPLLTNACLSQSEAVQHFSNGRLKPIEIYREVLLNANEAQCDTFLESMPIGYGRHKSTNLLHMTHELCYLWSGNNPAIVLYVENALVSDEMGRSLAFDETTTMILEPDAGPRYMLARTGYDARRSARPHTGQFCVWRHEPSHLNLRIFCLVLIVIVASVLFSTASLYFPLVLGRKAFALIGNPLNHDIYHWGFGGTTIVSLYQLVEWSVRGIRAQQYSWFIALIFRANIIWKWTVALVTFGVLLPLSCGIAFQLIFVYPIQGTDYSQASYYFPQLPLFQNWGLGLLIGQGIARAISLGWFGVGSWYMRLTSLHLKRGYDFDLKRLLVDVGLPFFSLLASAVILPFVGSVIVIHTLEISDPLMINKILRYGYPGYVLLVAGWRLSKSLAWIFPTLHDTIRDKRYLVGPKLQNKFS